MTIPKTEALASLHASGISHRSLHPEHILIGADGHIIVTGFACASVTTFNSPRTEQKAIMEEKEKVARALNIWSAPEVILGWTHDSAVDIWGFGMILHYMLTGQVSI
jgi:serine/threonine protein kinase